MKHPTSHHVFTVVTQTWLNPEIGLPHQGVKFEKGAFAALKVKALFNWPELDQRFSDHGIDLHLHQARGPKAKSAIEHFIGSFHRQLSHLPGYCGNHEKETCPAKLRRFIDSLKRVEQPRKAEVDPEKMLHTKEGFDLEVKRALGAIRNEPQNGKRLQGLSPAEAWKQFASGKPAKVLPDSLRYLLATQRFTRRVQFDGLKLKHGKWDERTYLGSERLGAVVGEEVEVYFNPQIPEHVICVHRRSDPRGVDPFSVPLLEPLKANGATKEDFARAGEHRRAFMAASRATYIGFNPPSSLTIRNERLASPDTHERGESINAIEREQIELTADRKRHGSTIRQRGAKNGLRLDPAIVKNPERVTKSLSKAEAFRREALRQEAEQAADPQP